MLKVRRPGVSYEVNFWRKVTWSIKQFPRNRFSKKMLCGISWKSEHTKNGRVEWRALINIMSLLWCGHWNLPSQEAHLRAIWPKGSQGQQTQTVPWQAGARHDTISSHLHLARNEAKHTDGGWQCSSHHVRAPLASRRFLLPSHLVRNLTTEFKKICMWVEVVDLSLVPYWESSCQIKEWISICLCKHVQMSLHKLIATELL